MPCKAVRLRGFKAAALHARLRLRYENRRQRNSIATLFTLACTNRFPDFAKTNSCQLLCFRASHHQTYRLRPLIPHLLIENNTNKARHGHSSPSILSAPTPRLENLVAIFFLLRLTNQVTYPNTKCLTNLTEASATALTGPKRRTKARLSTSTSLSRSERNDKLTMLR